MIEIIDKGLPFEREVWNRSEAINYFTEQGELYKAEIVKDLPEGSRVPIDMKSFNDFCWGKWATLEARTEFKPIGKAEPALINEFSRSPYKKGTHGRVFSARSKGVKGTTTQDLGVSKPSQTSDYLGGGRRAR